MACPKIQDSLKKASIGASMLSFVRKTGSLKTTCSRSEAQGKLHKSLASPTPQCFSGFVSMESQGARFQRREASSIGVRSGQTIQCGTVLVNSIQIGAAASPQTGRPSTPAKNGNQHAARYGRETTLRASGAASSITRESRFTFTTSHPSPSRNCGQRHRTFCLSASPVTNGFTQEGM